MGKIVKFCSSCDEGFAEKFGFCPNCGQSLQTFEMSPVIPEAPAPKEVVAAPIAAVAPPPPVEVVKEAAPVEKVVEKTIIEEPVVAKPVEVPVTKVPNVKKAAATVPFVQKTVVDADAKKPASDGWVNVSSDDDDAFRVTVIEEKNVGTRRALLVGSLGAMILVLMTGMVYSLFSKDLEVGSINDDIFNAVIVDELPTEIEEDPQLKKDKDGGGGGGGGREEKEETTQGDLADQVKTPTRPPDAKTPRLENPSLKLDPPTTEGNRTSEKKFDRWGDPNGRFASFSNGTGSGGGQGSGVGTGQGSGRGTGQGSGIGSGSGSGIGNGNGGGTGDGNGEDAPPPPRPAGVTQPWKLISRPRPGYTDAARTAGIQGTVILRVTFLASGQVGSITPVKGLPNGLTEQAIAAARGIRFEPMKKDGVAQSTTKQIEYTFSIY